jgi:hypothetical protein
MKKLVLAVACIVAVPSLATADDAEKRAEAQKKIDEAKIKGCEALKANLVKNKTCPDQSAAAAKVTCTVAAFADITKLHNDCAKASKDRADEARNKADAKKAAPKDTSCKATEGSASVHAGTSATFTACMKDVKAATIKAMCTAGVKKAKVTYQYAGRKPLPMTVLCPK